MKKYLLCAAMLAALIYLAPLVTFLLPSSPASTSSPLPLTRPQSSPTDISASASQPAPFHILNLSSGSMEIVPVIDYVIGAVAAEMPMSYADEALKAQAIAAYSYALAQKNSSIRSEAAAEANADFEADPARRLGYLTKDMMKALWGDDFDTHYQRLTALVKPLTGIFLSYQDSPALACYHASSNGATQSAQQVWGRAVPYLVSVASPSDTQQPGFEQTITMTAQEMKDSLTSAFAGIDCSGDPKTWFGTFQKNPEGYVEHVRIGEISCKAQDIRTALGLRSTDFTITWIKDHFSITTRGYGHGVGMSQAGANAMAQQGKTAAEILAYYYPGTTLSKYSG